MYLINEWMERYEVNAKGRKWFKGDELRVHELLYIRSKVHGHSESNGWKYLRKVAGRRAPEVFGIFQKLLEIAADDKSQSRGKLLRQKGGKPATVEDLSFITGISTKQIQYALDILEKPPLRWIINDSRKLPETPGNVRGIPDSLYKTRQVKTRKEKKKKDKKEKEVSPKPLSSEEEKRVLFKLLFSYGVKPDTAVRLIFTDRHPAESIRNACKNMETLNATLSKSGLKVFNKAGYIVKAMNNSRVEGKVLKLSKSAKVLQAEYDNLKL